MVEKDGQGAGQNGNSYCDLGGLVSFSLVNFISSHSLLNHKLLITLFFPAPGPSYLLLNLP